MDSSKTSARKKRRGHGEGTIFHRDDGRWSAVADLGWVDGKRKRKTLYGSTRAEVAEALVKLLRDRQLGHKVADDQLTLEQFLRRWLDERVRPRLRPTTAAGYEEVVRLFLVPGLGKYKLSKLCPGDVQRFLNRRLEETGRPSRVRYMRAVLRAALSQAVRWELVPRNVAALTDAPTVEKRKVAPLDPAQARKLLDAAKGARHEALFAVALAVGLRRGEVIGLRWDHVDLEKGLIFVREQRQRVKGEVLVLGPKSETSRRDIRLPEVCLRALCEHRRRQAAERLQLGEEWTETGYVFTTRNGRPLDGRNVSRYFKQALAKAGLPAKRFHDARHTCASLLLAQGVPGRVVMDILGHSDIRLTLNTYSHVIPQLHDEAAEKMDAVLG